MSTSKFGKIGYEDIEIFHFLTMGGGRHLGFSNL